MMEITTKEQSKFRKVLAWIIDSVPYSIIMGLLIMFMGEVVFFTFENIIHLTPADDLSLTMYLYYSFIGIWVGFLLVMIIIPWNRFMLKQLWTKRKGNTIRNLLIGLLIGAGSNMLCIIAAMLNKDIHVYYAGVNLLPLLLIFICVFIQSSAEELTCRVYMMEKILKRHRPITAIVATASVFAVLHLFNSGINTIAVIDLVISGLQFAVIAYYMDSIWCAFMAHTGWNFTQNILMGLPNSGQMVPVSVFKLDIATARDSFFYNVGFGVEGTIFSVIVNIAVLAAVYFIYRKTRPSILKKPEQIG